MFAFSNVPVGKLTATVNAWSPDDASQYRLQDWSLRSLQGQEDVFKYHSLANGLRATLCSIGAKIAYAPSVANMSAVIAHPEDLKKDKIQLGEIELYRNPGFPADGVFLQPGEAFVMSAADCPPIIATAGEHMIVSHAGLRSLAETGAVLGRPSRRHISVVYTIIEELLKKGESLNEIVLYMMFCVPAEMFDHHPLHPEHGTYNRKLVEMVDTLWNGSTFRKNGNVFLDMESIFVKQAREMGVYRAWATHSLREFPALAHTRDGKDPSRRNLFVVKRNA